MITDKNKNLSGNGGIDQTSGAIQYNLLNLPWKITVKKEAGVTNDDGSTNKGTITYIYDAAGNKLEKRVYEAASSVNSHIITNTSSTYIGAFIYETKSSPPLV